MSPFPGLQEKIPCAAGYELIPLFPALFFAGLMNLSIRVVY